MSKVRAVHAHMIPDRPPLRLSVGQRVTVGQQDTRWPAFVLVTAEAGQGWVPSRHLELDQESGAATVIAPYDTTELPTTVGETLRARFTTSFSFLALSPFVRILVGPSLTSPLLR
jgi:hypothetical protein